MACHDDDTEDSEGGGANRLEQDVMECVCRIMITEDTIQDEQKNLVPDLLPGLSIEEYSNDVYWKFRPHLEPVHSAFESWMLN